MNRHELLARSPLLKDVPSEAIRMVEQAVTEAHYAPHDTVVSQEAPGEALFFLTEGVARVSRVGVGGRERILGFAYAPAVIGEASVLTSEERSATVTAETPLSALMLYRDHFRQVLTRYPQVLWNLASILASRISHQNDELIAFGVSTEAACAYVLLGLYRQRQIAGERDPARIPLTQADLTLRLSTSRETVTRVLRRLEKEGYVKTETGAVRVADPDGLDALIFGIEEQV